MRIRALASPSFVFDAHPDAAKELIEGGLYEKVEDESPANNSTQPTTEPKPIVRRRPKTK